MYTWKSILKAIVLVCAVIAISTFMAGASTQSTTASSTEVLPALLTEVHALRVAMEQQATISPRIQLSMARLNIEEQRMTQLTGQLDQIRRQLSDITLESQRTADAILELDKSLLTEKDPNKRDELQQAQRDVKRRQTAQSAFEQQLRSRESETARTLDTEQARWIELNSRIDELERLLAPVRKP